MHPDVHAVARMAWLKRKQYWMSHEAATSDYWRNMFGILAEAWGQVARELDPNGEASDSPSEVKE